MLAALVMVMALSPGLAVSAMNEVETATGWPKARWGHGDGYTKVAGTRAGALYELLRPDDWNGDLVLLMHGTVPPNLPVELPPFGHEPLWSDLIDRLISEGYGVAYSSYRVNGIAIAAGTTDTRIAQAMFTASFGKPDETYLVGISMGGQIGQKLIESSHVRYDGLLAICSPLGGATLQTAYFSDVRILFDYYFPGVLPGDVWNTPNLDFESAVLPAVVAAITESDESFQLAVELAGIDQLEIPWTTPEELVFSIAASLAPSTIGIFDDLKAKAGGIPFDNTETSYTGSSDDVALNAGIMRFAADPNAEQYQRRLDPTGKVHDTPVLALQTTRDPNNPHQIHFPAYLTLLAEMGNEHLFEARFVDRFGHCFLSTDEIFTAFEDLVLWSVTGTAPSP